MYKPTPPVVVSREPMFDMEASLYKDEQSKNKTRGLVISHFGYDLISNGLFLQHPEEDWPGLFARHFNTSTNWPAPAGFHEGVASIHINWTASNTLGVSIFGLNRLIPRSVDFSARSMGKYTASKTCKLVDWDDGFYPLFKFWWKHW
jgi:hypothetical protein